jgi:hypothetical protein
VNRRERFNAIETREQELSAYARETRWLFELLNRATPDEARDKHGWTPELLAAARRHALARRERRKYSGYADEVYKTL